MPSLPSFNFTLTDEQKKQIRQWLITAAISVVMGLLTIFTVYEFIVQPQLAAERARLDQLRSDLGFETPAPSPDPASPGGPFPLATSSRYDYTTSPVFVKQTGIDAFKTWNGSGIKLYSDAGTTLKFGVNGVNGNTTIAGTLLVTGTQTFAGAQTFTGATTHNAAVTINNNATITGTLGVTGVESISSGTNALPALTFTGDTNTGLYRVGTDNLALTAGGTKVLDCTAAGCTNTGTLGVTGVESISSGTNALPALTFTGDTNTGLYRVDTDNLALTAGGTKVLDCTAAGCTNTGTLGVTGTQTFTGATTHNAAVTINNNATITGTLTLGGSTQSGAVRYGTAATYTSGESITHGFSVTPTVCIASPARDVTSTLTITTTGFSWDTASRSEPIFWMCGR